MNYKETSNENLKTANDNLVAVYEQSFSIEPKLKTQAECDAEFKACMAAAKSDMAKLVCKGNYQTCQNEVK